jgi:Fur family ferric uptake transcriptional regulator
MSQHKSDHHEASEQEQALMKDLKDVGLKITAPRLKILELLEKGKQPNQKRHWSAEEIHQHLMREGDDVGLATVYRVLTQFEKAQIVIRHHFDGQTAVYEIHSDSHHDHLVCVDCGHVEEFFDQVIETRQRDIADRLGYQISDHALSLFVRCKKNPCPHK